MTTHSGRYEMREELGHGGMAVVHRAWDPDINRQLAVKLLRPERCTDPDYRARFLREAKAAGALSHPNIVTIYDVGENDNQPYIAMELLGGTPLDRLIKDGHAFSLDDILHIMLQLARALDYAHRNGIVHRDIKPSNIIYFDGAEPGIKITDFGIARVEDASFTQQTQAGDVLGTPQYMSPEQVLGQTVDGRSDLFSVGVIFYELLTGHKPFHGDSIATLMFRIATEEPGPLQSPRFELPPALRRIVGRLLHKEPEKRYNGAELVEAIQDLLALRDSALPPTPQPPELNRPVEPPPVPERRSLPLRFSWPLLSGLLVALIYAPAAGWLYQNESQKAYTAIQDTGAKLLRLLRRETATPVLSGDWALVDMIIRDLSEEPEVTYLRVADHQGRVQVGSPGRSLPASLSPPLSLEAPGGDSNGITTTEIRDNGEPLLQLLTAIRFDDQVVGYIQLGTSLTDYRYYIRSLRNNTVAVGAVLVLTVMLLSFVFAGYTSHTLVELRKGLQELVRGNVNYRLTRERRGPAYGAHKDFNRLAAWVRDQGIKQPANAGKDINPSSDQHTYPGEGRGID